MTTNQASRIIGLLGFSLAIKWELTKFNNGTKDWVPTFTLRKDGKIVEESRHVVFSQGIQAMCRQAKQESKS